MKNLLNKFRISAALDAGQPIPPALDQRLARSDDLRRFATRAAHLDRSLRDSLPDLDMPADLHEAVMRKVLATLRPSAPARSRWTQWRWLPAPALTALALVAICWALQRPATLTLTRPPGAGPPLAAGIAALEWGDALTRRAPEKVLAPLSEEMARLEHDLNRSAAFLLASLP